MAQLPPKIPIMSPNWPGFSHQRSPTMFLPPATSTAPMQPSWVDEFLDFSTAKRNAHRRSASNSITFLEAPLDESPLKDRHKEHEFDRLDEEQLMSMFSDDAQLNSTISTPSEHSSINEDNNKPNEMLKQPIKNEIEEANSVSQAEQQAAPVANETIMDPKRVKRILANRQSAQRSRVRKLQYISELERSVTSLQTEVSTLSPRVAFFDHQRSILTVGNSALRQRIAALAQDKIFKDAHQEALKKEIERLREVYHKQSLKNMAEDSAATATGIGTGTAATTENTASTEQNC